MNLSKHMNEQNQHRNPVEKNQVAANFSRSASSYDSVAVLQQQVVHELMSRLQYIRHEPRRILDVGCGSGYALPLLRRRFPAASIVALDLAPGMLQQARAKISWPDRWRKRVQFINADMEQLPLADDSVDFIFSSLALQWCQSLQDTLAEFYRVLAPGGLLLFASLGPDTLKELRRSWAQVDAHAHVNQFLDMHIVGDTLMGQGFENPVMDMDYTILQYSSVKALMLDLKQLGSRNANSQRSKRLTGKNRLQAMMQAYEHFRQQGQLPATYEVVYGHAWMRAQKFKTAKDLMKNSIPLKPV